MLTKAGAPAGSSRYVGLVTDEEALLARMRSAPEDEGPRLAYAGWLLDRGDARGELILLDHRERKGEIGGSAELGRLLELAAEHGFPRLPDDPDAAILRWRGGGSYPVQYDLDHDGHRYYLRWRYGFSIDVDDVTVLECDLDLGCNEWTFREANAILAIVSAAVTSGASLAELTFPDEAGFRTHPSYRVGRCPTYAFPHELMRARGLEDHDWTLDCRDHARWYDLWNWLQTGRRPEPRPPRCRCGVPGLSCGKLGCDFR